MSTGYLAIYESTGNMWEGQVFIRADSLVEAQDKFFAWVKVNPIYTHLWRLTVSFKCVEEV